MTIPLGAGPVVLVADLASPEVDDVADVHLRRSRRLRPGAAVALTDGVGAWRSAVLTTSGVEPAGAVQEVEAPAPLCVAFAPTKGDRPSWTVQKLAELGIDHVMVLACDRSVVRWSDDSGALDKLRRVAREALQQSRRAHLTRVTGPHAVDEAVDIGCVLADLAPSARAISECAIEIAGVAIGPEGGWSDAERERFGHLSVRLADGVLRTETAAVTAAAVMTQRRI